LRNNPIDVKYKILIIPYSNHDETNNKKNYAKNIDERLLKII